MYSALEVTVVTYDTLKWTAYITLDYMHRSVPEIYATQTQSRMFCFSEYDPVTRVGPTGAAKIVRAPAKITGLFMLKKVEKDQMATVCCVPWTLEQTAESHSLLSRLSRACMTA